MMFHKENTTGSCIASKKGLKLNGNHAIVVVATEDDCALMLRDGKEAQFDVVKDQDNDDDERFGSSLVASLILQAMLLFAIWADPAASATFCHRGCIVMSDCLAWFAGAAYVYRKLTADWDCSSFSIMILTLLPEIVMTTALVLILLNQIQAAFVLLNFSILLLVAIVCVASTINKFKFSKISSFKSVHHGTHKFPFIENV